jgi:hypothetical protein
LFVGNEVVGLDYRDDGNIISGGGGGMKNGDESYPIVTNCTFFNNSVTYYSYCGNNDGSNGGGMKNGSYSAPIVTNCIIWGNTPNNIAESISGTYPVLTYSDVEGGYTGVGNIDLDPLLLEDHSLSEGSPCIDSGIETSSASYGSVIDDILGISRPQGGAYDMGAFEYKEEDEGNLWDPIVMKPLVTFALGKANTIWACLLEQMPQEVPEDLQILLEEVQGRMVNAAMLSNPVLANGALNQAMALMKQISEELDCGCYPE